MNHLMVQICNGFVSFLFMMSWVLTAHYSERRNVGRVRNYLQAPLFCVKKFTWNWHPK